MAIHARVELADNPKARVVRVVEAGTGDSGDLTWEEATVSWEDADFQWASTNVGGAQSKPKAKIVRIDTTNAKVIRTD